MWNFLPEHVVNAPSVDSFKNRLDKQWSNEDILYAYKAATPAGRKPFAPAGTQDLTIEAKACGKPLVSKDIVTDFGLCVFFKL